VHEHSELVLDLLQHGGVQSGRMHHRGGAVPTYLPVGPQHRVFGPPARAAGGHESVRTLNQLLGDSGFARVVGSDVEGPAVVRCHQKGVLVAEGQDSSRDEFQQLGEQERFNVGHKFGLEFNLQF